MWKNWIPFRRKEKDNADSAARSAATVMSNGKENTLTSQHEGNVGRREYGHGAGDFRTEMKNYPNFSIGNFNVSTSNISSEGMLSVLNASGPLLSSPLLPKIKRAVELNQSLSEYSISSPLRRSVIKRPISPNYGPTHPTQSNPGRLPVVRLEKRPSLLDIRKRSLLSPGRRLLSPSTVKVAPPDPRMLSSPSFRMSPVQTPSATKNVVDTQMVVAALRERRKRSNLHVDENVLEESIMQTAKRRRQDSSQAVTSTASIPIMTDVLTDMSQETNSLNSLFHMEKMALKRSPVLGNELQETSAIEIPVPKLSQKESRSSILSSLSSSKRAAQNKTAGKEFPQGKCVKSQMLLQPEANQVENKKQSLDFSCSTEKVISSRIPASTAGFFESINFTHVVDKNVNKSSSDQMTSVEKSLDLNAQLNRRRAINIYPSLKSSPGKSINIATSADFESDRREEDARRVQDVLAYLDGNEPGQAETSKPSAVLANFTSSSSAFPGKGIITPNTTASSLTELLSSSGNATQTFATITTTPSLNTLAPEVTSHVTTTSLSFLAPTPTLVTSDALSKNTAGLVQSSGVSASTSLIQSTPICSTGISSLPGSQGKPAGGTPLVLGIPSTSSVGVASRSAALAAVLTTSASAATSSIASTSPDKKAFTFTPLFGTMQMPPVSINNFHPTASMSEPFTRGSLNLVASPSPSASTTSSSSSVAGTASASVISAGVFPGVSTSSTVISGTSQAVSSGERGGITQTPATTSSSSGFSFEAASNINTSATTSAGGFFIGSSDIQLPSLAPSTGGFTFGKTDEQVVLTSMLGGADMNTSSSGKSLQPKNLFGTSKENEGKPQPTFNNIPGFGGFGSAGTQPGLPLNSQDLTSSSQASITTTTNNTLSFGSPMSETPFGMKAASTVSNIFQQGNSAVIPQGGIFGTPASTTFSFGTTSSKTTFALGAQAANTSATAGAPSFGSAASAVTTTSSAPATSLFAFGQTPVTTLAAVTSAPASTFVFGQAQAATKLITSATPNNSLFACGQAPAMPTATSSTSTGSLFAFGQTPATTTTNTIAPANGLFTFGQTQTSTATNSAALTNSPFTFGKTPGTTTAANNQPPAGGLFTFGQIPATSSSTQPAASNLFTFGQKSAATTTNTQATPNSLFTFSQTASGNSFAFGQKPASTAVTTTVKNLFTLGQAPPTTSTNTFQFGPSAATASNQPFAFGTAGTTNSGNTFTFGTSTNASGSSGFSFGASGPTTTSSSNFNFGTSSVGMGGFASAPQQHPLQNSFGGNSSFSLGSAQPQQGFNFGNSTSAGFAFGSASNTGQVLTFGSSSAPNTVQSGQTFGSTSSVPAFGGSHSQTVGPVFGMSGSQSAAGASTTSGSAPFAFGATGGNAQQSSAPFAFGGSVTPNTGANTGFQFAQPSAGSTNAAAFHFSTAVGTSPQFNFGGPAPQGSAMFTTGAGSTAAKPRANAMKARRRVTRK